MLNRIVSVSHDNLKFNINITKSNIVNVPSYSREIYQLNTFWDLINSNYY